MMPGSLLDSSGRYRLAIQDQWDRLLIAHPDKVEGINETFAALAESPAGSYRPLPTAKAFHQSKKRQRFILGGNRCLGPDTLIERPDGDPRRVADIRGPHEVWAWDGNRRVRATAGEPWIKGWEPCYRVHLASGRWFDCSGEHRVLTGPGVYAAINLLNPSIHCLIDPGGDKVKISSIVQRGIQLIYDFEVPKWHNYATCGAVHHNSSKSFALAMETYWAATGWHPWREFDAPNEGFYATTTWEKVGDTLWAKLKHLLSGIPHDVAWHNKQRDIPEIVFVQPKNKLARKFWSKIGFKAYEQGREAFQAVALRYIHNDEQFPQDIWIEENSRIGGDYPLDIACAFTPIDPQTWLEGSLTDKRPASWDVFEFPLDDNRVSRGGFIADDQIDAMIEMWPPEVRETRRNGKWGSFLGSIYQTFSREVHVVSEEKEQRLFFPGGQIPPGSDVFGGIDWGGANPFVFLWMTRTNALDGDLYVFDEYYWDPRQRGGRRLEQHAEEIKARNKRWGCEPVRVWADHDPTNVLEFYHLGIPSQRAIKDDVRGGIEVVQTYMNPRGFLSNANWPTGRPRLHFAARCENCIREHAGYKWTQGTDKRDAREEPVKLNDHTCDATRYLVVGEKAMEGYSGNSMPPSTGQFRRTF